MLLPDQCGKGRFLVKILFMQQSRAKMQSTHGANQRCRIPQGRFDWRKREDLNFRYPAKWDVSPEQNPNFLPKQSERGLICAPRPLPSVAGAKTKNFPSFLRFSAGVGEADKKWKGKFWFCFAASKFSLSQYAKFRYCNPAYTLIVLW